MASFTSTTAIIPKLFGRAGYNKGPGEEEGEEEEKKDTLTMDL